MSTMGSTSETYNGEHGGCLLWGARGMPTRGSGHHTPGGQTMSPAIPEQSWPGPILHVTQSLGLKQAELWGG